MARHVPYMLELAYAIDDVANCVAVFCIYCILSISDARDRWPQGLDIRANHIAWLQRCDNAILDDVPMEADVEAGRLRVDTFLVLADQIRKWAPVLLASAADQDEERVLLGSHIDLLERAAASLEPEEWAEHAWRTGYEYCIISNMKAVEAVVRGGNIDLCDLGGFRAVYYVYNCC